MHTSIKMMFAITIVTAFFLSLSISVKAEAAERISGEDRIGTAIEISQYGWENSDAVVIARSDHPADALASAGIVEMADAPILLSRTNSLDSRIMEEVLRLDAQTVYLLGGEAALSSNVEQELRSAGVNVERVSGSTRYETAEEVNDTAGYASASSAILVSGEVAADALSASGMAVDDRLPIYLTKKDSLSTDLPSSVNYVTIFGGTNAVSSEVVEQLEAQGVKVRRIKGDTRYETSVKAAASYSPGNYNLLVRGTSVKSDEEDYPDAVAAAGLANKIGASIVLSHPSQAQASTTNYLSSSYNTNIILGGTAAISDQVKASYEEAAPGDSPDSVELVEGISTYTIDNIIASGEKYIGTPYQFGAPPYTTETFDCSSFLQLIFAENGVTLPRTSRQQYQEGVEVPEDQLEKGDLVFFDTTNDGSINHVSMYIDEETLFHATLSRGVDYTGFTNYWRSHMVGAKRITEE